MSELGLYLRSLREIKHLSMNDVYKETSITNSKLSRIESGSVEEPSAITLKKLANLYNVDVINLFTLAGFLDKSDLLNYKKVFLNVDLLTDEEKELIQQQINLLTKQRANTERVKNMNFRLGELFCGPGGIAWGATNARIADNNFSIVHQWSNDYDKDTCETYRRNICPEHPNTVYHADIRKFDMTSLPPIDALAFGFPCNDYSVVGEQKGMDGVFGPLYSYGIKALKQFQPMWFLAENVGGLRNANDGRAFAKILDELRNAGYTLTPHLYKFEEYGIPQARHRIIIVGIRNDLDIVYHVPSPAPYAHLDNTCRNSIENPPIPDDAFNNERTRQSDVVVRRLQHILPGQNAFTADLPEELRLNVKGAKISQIYKRLDPTRPAYTVTGSGGGGTHIYHWEEPRALTNRERARLQTFPDTYEFLGSKESVRKQIGMAVPCRGAQIIFEAILNSFAGIEYENIPANINE
ncbi:DNA (cytosine-5-)-methyltransferase [Clostridium sp. CTA-1]